MKTAIMIVEFEDGVTLTYEPHTFMLLPSEFSKVINWYRKEITL